MVMESSTAVLVASALATTGWLYAARRARTLSKKQHTINAILQSNFNERFLAARAAISPHLRAGECPKEVLDAENDNLVLNFRNILNHYEFISAGIRNGDFDEKLVRDSERGTYIALFECCEKYIWKLRDSRNRQTIYEHLEWLHGRWKANPPSQAVKIIEFIRGRPFYGRKK